MQAIENRRSSYAAFVTANAEITDPRIARAFAAVPRELFLGDGPWKIRAGFGYFETVSADPALVYEDVVVPLRPDKRINNGQPSLHARCFGAAEIREGDRILHIGCGSGYYTALLAELTTGKGLVIAWDIEASLAAAATRNLARWKNVEVECRSGTEAPIPESDLIYVSAGCTHPPRIWIDSLADGGRLIFPLTPGWGAGGILKVTRRNGDYEAKFVCSCQFIPCVGAHNAETEKRLAEAFARGDSNRVSSLRFDTSSPESQTCWFKGDGWWLATQ